MRVGLLEVSHWHFPLYRDALYRSGAQVVAVSDRDHAVAEREAGHFGAHAYTDPLALATGEQIDFAFVFGRHAEMPAIAHALVERDVAISLEKPGGLDAGAVATLRAAAERRDLYAAVALVQRDGPLDALLDALVAESGARFTHSSWRFLGGPPGRYPASGNAWMLDPAVSGGGCLTNLGPHFVDFACRLHGPPRGAVLARLSSALHRCAVEDYALVSMAGADGATATIEVGYCFPEHPDKREFSFTLTGPAHYVRSTPDGVRVLDTATGTAREHRVDLDSDPLYERYVNRVIEDFAAGRPPVANLGDLERVMGVIDAARAAAAAAP